MELRILTGQPQTEQIEFIVFELRDVQHRLVVIEPRDDFANSSCSSPGTTCMTSWINPEKSRGHHTKNRLFSLLSYLIRNAPYKIANFTLISKM